MENNSEKDQLEEKENSNEKSPLINYFSLEEAVEEVKLEFSIGDNADKAKASAKLLGKTIFNLGLFAGKLGVEVVKNAPEIIASHAQKKEK